MKPHKTFLFLLSIFLVLSLISLIFPANGIHIGNNFKLQFPDIKSILVTEESKYADISEILEYHQSEITDYINDIKKDTLLKINDTIYVIADSLKAEIRPDSLPIKTSIEVTTPKKQPGSIRQPLEYSDNNKTVLYSFFGHLKNLKKSGELIRVLHYGDSQIEGDRITSYIRNELQKQFGGLGIGMFAPVKP